MMFTNVNKLKMITTIMDIVGAVLAASAIVSGAVLLSVNSGFMDRIINYLRHHEFDELTGGYEVIGGNLAFLGSLLGVMMSFILFAVAVMILLTFLIPSIHGILFCKKTDQYLANGSDSYRKAAVRDSIIKLIFNGIPAVLFLTDFIGSWIWLEGVLILYYAVVCGLEIIVLARKDG